MSSSSCPQSGCIDRCKNPTLVNGLQNQILDIYNRTSYLAAPHAVGPSLATVIPSSALSVAPVQGCNGYSFASTAPTIGFGGVGGPLAAPLAAPLGGPVAPTLGVATSLMPSVSSGYGVVSQTPGYNSVFSNSPYQNIGVNNINAPYGTSSQVTQNVLSGTPTNGTKPIQKSPPPAPDPRSIVGPPTMSSSTKNLMTATGQTCSCDQIEDFSSPVEQKDPMDYIPQGYQQQSSQQAPNIAAYGSIPVTAPQPVGVAPGIAVGGVGGIAVASPAFLGGTPNVNVAAGIAFANECGPNWGINAPLGVVGPVAPAVSVLGSNYLNNLAYVPYYSGLNQSEPAAVMHSSNPLQPGFMMLARAWNGCPNVIISKPDQYGCPTFETISIETHAENCNCAKCNCFNIDNCEYRCINGFGESDQYSDSLILVGNNLLSSNQIPDNTLIFTIVAAQGYPLAGFNTSGLALAVNNEINRNLVLYKECCYNILLKVDPGLKGISEELFNKAQSFRANLIFTIDPCGKDLDVDCSDQNLANQVKTYANKAGWTEVSAPPGPCKGMTIGEKNISYCPPKNLFRCLVTTIYYQFFGFSYGGGPITILGDVS